MYSEKMLSRDNVARFLWGTVFLSGVFNALSMPLAIGYGSHVLSFAWKPILVLYAIIIGWGIRLPKKEIPLRIIMLPIGIICIVTVFIHLQAHQTVLIYGLKYNFSVVMIFSIAAVSFSLLLIGKWFSKRLQSGNKRLEHSQKQSPLVISVAVFAALLGKLIFDIISENAGESIQTAVMAYGWLWVACMFSWGFSGIYFSLKLYKEHGAYVKEKGGNGLKR